MKQVGHPRSGRRSSFGPATGRGVLLLLLLLLTRARLRLRATRRAAAAATLCCHEETGWGCGCRLLGSSSSWWRCFRGSVRLGCSLGATDGQRGSSSGVSQQPGALGHKGEELGRRGRQQQLQGQGGSRWQAVVMALGIAR